MAFRLFSIELYAYGLHVQSGVEFQGEREEAHENSSLVKKGF